MPLASHWWLVATWRSLPGEILETRIDFMWCTLWHTALACDLVSSSRLLFLAFLEFVFLPSLPSTEEILLEIMLLGCLSRGRCRWVLKRARHDWMTHVGCTVEFTLIKFHVICSCPLHSLVPSFSSEDGNGRASRPQGDDMGSLPLCVGTFAWSYVRCWELRRASSDDVYLSNHSPPRSLDLCHPRSWSLQITPSIPAWLAMSPSKVCHADCTTVDDQTRSTSSWVLGGWEADPPKESLRMCFGCFYLPVWVVALGSTSCSRTVYHWPMTGKNLCETYLLLKLSREGVATAQVDSWEVSEVIFFCAEEPSLPSQMLETPDSVNTGKCFNLAIPARKKPSIVPPPCSWDATRSNSRHWKIAFVEAQTSRVFVSTQSLTFWNSSSELGLQISTLSATFDNIQHGFSNSSRVSQRQSNTQNCPFQVHPVKEDGIILDLFSATLHF